MSDKGLYQDPGLFKHSSLEEKKRQWHLNVYGSSDQQSFMQGVSALRSNHLPYYIPFFFIYKSYPFGIPSIDKWYPFQRPNLELCIPFNWHVNVLSLTYENITTKPERFRVFLYHSHKLHQLQSLLGLFTDRKDIFSYPFITQKPEKSTPFGRGLHLQTIMGIPPGM